MWPESILGGPEAGGNAAIAAAANAGNYVVNVRDPEFGAAGDGVTDDSAAIQAAMDSLYATLSTLQRSGGVVRVPAGNYKIGAALQMRSGVSLAGDGPRSTRLFGSVSGMTILEDYAPSSSEWKRYTISGILFDGGGADASSGSSRLCDYGINANGMHASEIRNCQFVRFTERAIFSDLLVVDLLVARTNLYGGGGFYHDGAAQGATTIKYRNCNIALSDGRGLELDNVAVASVSGCVFERNTESGLYLDGTSAGIYSVTGSYFEHNASGSGSEKRNLYVNALRARISDSYFVYTSASGVTGLAHILLGASATNTTIEENTFNSVSNAPSYDIDSAAGAANVYVRNNKHIGANTYASTNAKARFIGDAHQIVKGDLPATEYQNEAGTALAVNYALAGGMDMRHATAHYFSDMGGAQRAIIDDTGLFLSGGGWNTKHLQLGGTHLWIDGSAKLRIKFGVPSSDTDGTVVGTQS